MQKELQLQQESLLTQCLAKKEQQMFEWLEEASDDVWIIRKEAEDVTTTSEPNDLWMRKEEEEQQEQQ